MTLRLRFMDGNDMFVPCCFKGPQEIIVTPPMVKRPVVSEVEISFSSS